MERDQINDAQDRLTESALDFLERAIGELESEPKYSVIHFAIGIELILKARLMNEHWALAIEKLSDASSSKFLAGNCKTVQPMVAIERLRHICGETISSAAESAFKRVWKHRNRMVHFYHDADGEGSDTELIQSIVAEQCEAWHHLQLLFRDWDNQFDLYKESIQRLAHQLRSNTKFLEKILNAAEPQLLELKKKGHEIQQCTRCNFEAAQIVEIKAPLFEANCLVCKARPALLRFACEGDCSAMIDLQEAETEHWNCSECGHEGNEANVIKYLTPSVEAAADFALTSNGEMNCGWCNQLGSVYPHGETFVCIKCLAHNRDVLICDWCSASQIGPYDFALSILDGCVACDGIA